MAQCHLKLQWCHCRPCAGRRCPTGQASLGAGFLVAASAGNAFLGQAAVMGTAAQDQPGALLSSLTSWIVEKLAWEGPWPLSTGLTQTDLLNFLKPNVPLLRVRYTQVDSYLWQSTDLGCSIHPSAPKGTSEKSSSIKLILLSC